MADEFNDPRSIEMADSPMHNNQHSGPNSNHINFAPPSANRTDGAEAGSFSETVTDPAPMNPRPVSQKQSSALDAYDGLRQRAQSTGHTGNAAGSSGNNQHAASASSGEVNTASANIPPPSTRTSNQDPITGVVANNSAGNGSSVASPVNDSGSAPPAGLTETHNSQVSQPPVPGYNSQPPMVVPAPPATQETQTSKGCSFPTCCKCD